MAERKRLLLRLDPSVYDAVAKWAADDLRSINAQIEYALRLALRTGGRELRRREPEPPPYEQEPEPLPHEPEPEPAPDEREPEPAPHEREPEEPAGPGGPGQ